MEKLIYERMLRKAAVWTGPCPTCGKPIHAGEVIRQPFAMEKRGFNRYADYWVCYPCAKRLHGATGSEMTPWKPSATLSMH